MKYKKDFDQWNVIKKQIDTLNQKVFCNEKEIWWCYLGTNVGSEQDGGDKYMRPVLIYKKTSINTFIAIPITRTLRHDTEHLAFYFEYDLQTMIINQIRVLDSKRLINKIGIISDYLFNKTKKKTTQFLG